MIPQIGSGAESVVARRGLGESGLRDDCQQAALAGLVGASWGETFKCLMAEVVSLGGDGVKRVVEWPAAVPGRRETGSPGASAGAGAGWVGGPCG